ncbi:MAG: HAD family hydrolase [Gaiellaceae bacterium MAG52_C11]|nr:HAD family hydrolase [Candidatus Gaiellasilicea maunaloa]
MAFDWNGTLADDSDRAWGATCSVLEKRGVVGPSAVEHLADFCLPLASHFAHYGVQEIPEAIAEWNAAMTLTSAKSMPGAKEMLERFSAAGVVVAVVSAASADVVQRDLAQMGLEEYVGLTFAEADPKRTVLEGLRQAHGGRVAFVGDTEYDMQEARAAGAIAIGFAGGYRPAAALAAAGAEFVVNRLEDLWHLTDRTAAPLLTSGRRDP